MPTSKQPSASHGRYWPYVKWLLIIILVMAAIYLALLPIRHTWSQKFLDRGDKLLAQKQYVSAIVEYRKAYTIYDKAGANSKIEVARAAENSVDTLENFYKVQNNIAELNKFAEAKEVPADEYQGVVLTKSYIEAGEYQLAIVEATNVTEMNKNYRDGWLYLGVANYMAAKNLEISKQSEMWYIDNAKSSLDKAKELDPSYQVTLDYISATEKL